MALGCSCGTCEGLGGCGHGLGSLGVDLCEQAPSSLAGRLVDSPYGLRHGQGHGSAALPTAHAGLMPGAHPRPWFAFVLLMSCVHVLSVACCSGLVVSSSLVEDGAAALRSAAVSIRCFSVPHFTRWSYLPYPP